ncbi:hypothetical protein ABEB36_009829 [Hypothenemus hampei]
MTILNNDISESLEDEESSPLLDDDITTRGLARLSSAATCLVAGIEYTHGQQIYRADPCEFCLCLDGEMFCWWQDCPPAMEGPCKNQGPFSPCNSVQVAPTIKTKIEYPQPSSQTLAYVQSTTGKSSSFTTQLPNEYSTGVHNEEGSSTYSTEEYSTSDNLQSSTEYESSTTEENKTYCIVMGQEYRVGENLPHSTGNCLECICGQGGKITCSPHQCVPAGDEINDYRQPDARQDVFE